MNFRAITKDLDKIALVFIILVFFIFGSYLVLNIRRGISPDENYHISVSEFYSETFLIPENSEETYRYGDITRIPYLSFWLNARLINLNFTNVEDYVVLRFFNLLISTGSLIVVYLIAKEVIKKKYLNLLPVFMLANTLMFVFLSSAVSYDNLVNFFVFLSFYFLIKTFKSRNNKWILFFLMAGSLAALTKFTAIPAFLIELVLLIIFMLKEIRFIEFLEEVFDRYKYLSLLLLVIIGFLSSVYGVNIIRYKSLTVSCDKILSEQQCMQNGVYSRAKTADLYEFSSLGEFVEILKERTTPFEYFSRWSLSMTQRIFGILGHEWLLMPSYFSNIYIFLFLILSIIFIRGWRRGDSIETNLLVIFLSYLLVLLIFQNYRSYIIRGRFDIAIQGRYLFPVIPLLYTILIDYLGRLKNKWSQGIIISFLVLVFFMGCIPFFFVYVTDLWFS